MGMLFNGIAIAPMRIGLFVDTPSAPSSLTVTTVSAYLMDLVWTGNSDDEDGFKIERSPDESDWSQIAIVGQNVTSYQDSGLTGNALYYYRVRAFASGSNSAYSNTDSDTTLVASTSSLQTSLTAFWKLTEITGSRVDATGRGNNLTATNTPGWAALAGGYANYFRRAQLEYLSIADTADVQAGNIDFTIALVVTLNDKSAVHNIVGKYSIDREYFLRYSDSSDRFEFYVSPDGGSPTSVTANNLGSPSVNTKYLIIVWHDPDADTINIQVNDGAVDTTSSYTGGINVAANPFQIGAVDTSNYTNGRIKNVGVWKKILTADERTTLWNDGIPLTYPFSDYDKGDWPDSSPSEYRVHMGAGSDKENAVRVPHQRSSIEAAGRYWVFYADYVSAGGPYNLNFISSADGTNWSSITTLTTIPFADAQWAINFDGTYLHIIKNTQTGTPVHDGLQYRRGTPNANGTITWSAAWQTVIATGNQVGDPSLTVTTDSKVVVGYNNNGSNGNAVVIKNDNTDGTWSTASGFPVTLTSSDDIRFAIVAPLGSGGIYAATYHWGPTDHQATGYYSSDGSSSFSSDGTITNNNLDMAAYTAPLEIEGLGDGVIHLTYLASDVSVYYKTRSAGGSWSSETQLTGSDERFSQEEFSAPRLSFDELDNVYVTWAEPIANIIFCAKYDGAWTDPIPILRPNLEPTRAHFMPALEFTSTAFQTVTLLDDYTLAHHIIDISGM